MIHGIVNIYKEKGYTSHDVVAILRKMLGQKKIGHTGTLDPEAEGVLPVALGAGTKLCDMLTDKDKTYRTTLLLGQVTDTQDTTGTVLETAPVTADEETVRAVIGSFVGDYDQVPPMYSALKVNGKKLYELAREGKTVERKSRRVCIREIVIEEIALPKVTMTVTCSKGTYIRTLCHDIGQKLGCGGCMEQLTRTRVGKFELSDSLTLARMQELVGQGHIEEAVVPVDAMFSDVPAFFTKPEADKMLYNGNALYVSQFCDVGALAVHGQQMSGEQQTGCKQEASGGNHPNGWIRVCDSQGKFCGIYKYDAEKRRYQPEKMFLM